MSSNNDNIKAIGEMPAVKTTIVGGRPPGSGKPVGNIPRGIEIIIKKASIDVEFKNLLLRSRSDAVESIELELEDAESAMLNAIPDAQLLAIIGSTKVTPAAYSAFMGKTAATMIAALAISSAAVAQNVDDEILVRFGVSPRDIVPNIEYGQIEGVVLTEDGKPIWGVEVYIDEVEHLTFTDKDGKFLIEGVSTGAHTLVIGENSIYEKAEIQISVPLASNDNLIFTLVESRIKEVLFTGSRPDNE